MKIISTSTPIDARPFQRGETATSITHPDLAVAVSTVFDVR